MGCQHSFHPLPFSFIYPQLRLLILILFQQGGFKEGQDLHEIHCKEITQFYASSTAKAPSGKGKRTVST
jgi:hypothetical protein